MLEIHVIKVERMIKMRQDKELNNKKVLKKRVGKQHQLPFENEAVLNYYSEGLFDQQKEGFFSHRVDDSNHYVVVFPTGLFLLVCFSTFQIQFQQQLNIKKESNIVDFHYSVSNDKKM